MKKIMAILMVMVTLIVFSEIPVFAVDHSGISPLLNNGQTYSENFVISSSGLSEVKVSYTGVEGVTTKVTVTTYLQKKTLGLFWTKVDIGTEDKQWVDTSTSISGTFVHQFQLKSTGTYRAVIKIVFSGSGGSDDVIENKIEKKYSNT